MDDEAEIVYEEGSIGDDLAKAFDSVEEKGDEPASTVHNAPEPSDGGDGDSEGGDQAAATDSPEIPAGKEPEPETDHAPISLPPAAREAWKDTPPAMKQAIAKREADYAKGVEKYREGAQRAQHMDEALQPYQQYLAMTGQPVGQTVSSLLQTASVLQMGTPVQRAQTVAQLISQFGVDISTLDSILADGRHPEPSQNDFVQQAVQQAIAPYQQFMTQFQQQQQWQEQQKTGQISTEIQDFATKNEFYVDVRGDMADILDMAANRGINMSMDEAYRRACLIHPEISQIIETRGKQPTTGQRRAASSLRGNSPGGVTVVDEADTLRGAIVAAWDNVGKG